MAKRSATTSAGLLRGTPREKEIPLPPLPKVRAPIVLSSLLGQERAAAVLTDALVSERVHHAWIFQGPMGVGKFTSALSFASMLLDPTLERGLSGELAPDPESHCQRLLASGTHPDLAVITKELARYHDDASIRSRKLLSISVEVVRQFILEPGMLSPSAQTLGSARSRAGRVFIIDQAELLNHNAQNAILKFLEEPPQRTVLILVCNSPEQLLPTIRSRCQRVAFATLGRASMEQWMRRAQPEIDPGAHDWLVSFADGAPGALLAAQESGVAGWWTSLGPMLDVLSRGKPAPGLGSATAALVDDWAKRWVETHDNASKESANRDGADWMFRVLAGWQRGLLARATLPEHIHSALAVLDALRSAESETDANVNGLFVFEKLAGELHEAMGAHPAHATRSASFAR